MSGEWRDGSWAEYGKVPLENCFVLDDARLTGNPTRGGLGYDVARLAYLQTLLVPYGGLRGYRASGGRDGDRFPSHGSVRRGDVASDTAALKSFGTIDAMLDISPPEAAGSTHSYEEWGHGAPARREGELDGRALGRRAASAFEDHALRRPAEGQVDVRKGGHSVLGPDGTVLSVEAGQGGRGRDDRVG